MLGHRSLVWQKTVFFKLEDFLMNHNGRLYMVQLLNLHLYVLFKPYKYYIYSKKWRGHGLIVTLPTE